MAVKNVLIVKGTFSDIYEHSWNRALNEIGVKSDIFDAHALTLPGILGRIECRILFGPGVSKIRKRLINRVQSERPDITLFYQGHYFDRDTLAQIQPYTFVVGYHDDDATGSNSKLLRYRLLLPALSQYQGYHVIRQENIKEFMDRGVPRVKLLRHSYRPWLHYPVLLSIEEQKLFGNEAVFIGHWEDDMRVECITKAVLAEINIRIYGPKRYWKPALRPDVYEKIKTRQSVFGEDYRKALCGAKIATAFLSKWNRDDHGMRSFEIPACGVFLLSERTPILQEFYQEGKEAEFFSSPEEFVDKLKFYLNNDTVRREIAEAGYRRVTTSGHDIYSRMRQWLTDVTQWKDSYDSTSK